MKGKKLMAICLMAVLAISMLAGCSAPPAPTAETPAPESPKKFALFMSHMSNAFTIELSEAVKTQAAELGAEVTVNDAAKDAAKQISQIETTVNQGIDGIIIEPVSVDAIVPAVKAAKEAGIPVIIVNQQISDPSAASAYVGVANKDGGAMEMTKAVADLGGKGNIALLLGPMGSDGQIGRSEGYKSVIDANPEIKVVFESTANWTTDEALKLAENWLQAGQDIKAIVAQNDGMALGALKAVEDAKMQDSIKVYGLDATPDALAAVKEGRLAATVSQSTTLQGLEAMKAAFALANGETVEPVKLVEFTLITIENVDQFIK